jgi:hypothetical protein
MAKTKITSKDVKSVADKLDAFAKELPQQERNVLGWVLARAQAGPSPDLAAAASKAVKNVPGLSGPTANQLGRAVGLTTAKPEVTVVVGWQYRFGKAKRGLNEILEK